MIPVACALLGKNPDNVVDDWSAVSHALAVFALLGLALGMAGIPETLSKTGSYCYPELLGQVIELRRLVN